MITLQKYCITDQNKYYMVLLCETIEDMNNLPDADHPMNPQNYAISQYLGEPANGSVAICYENYTKKYYTDGTWGEPGGGGSKIGYFELIKNEEGGLISYKYSPQGLLDTLQENDVVFIRFENSVGQMVDCSIYSYAIGSGYLGFYNGNVPSGASYSGDWTIDISNQIAAILKTNYPYTVKINIS